MKLKCIDIISIIGAIFGVMCIAMEIILAMAVFSVGDDDGRNDY